MFFLYRDHFLLLDNNRNKEKSMYFLYIHAVSVSNAKEQKEQSETADTGMADFTIKVCSSFLELLGHLFE